MQDFDFSDFNIKELIESGNVGTFYEKNPPVRKFRDTITFYIDGKIRFVRYCYGEAAGPILELWSHEKIGVDGTITWDYSKLAYPTDSKVPTRLYAKDNENAIYFDDEKYSWSLLHSLKTDPKNGYSWLKKILIKK